MSPEETSEHVAKVLPDMVDQATPQGQMPKQDPLNKGMHHLKKMFTSSG